MKLIVFALTALAAVVYAAPPNTLTESERAGGWRLLWDGHSFDGWRNSAADQPLGAGWSIADGALTVEGRGAGAPRNHLLTVDSFSAFELTFEFRLTPGANSGVKYLVTTVRNGARLIDIGPEYQLLDDERHPDAKRGVDGDRTLASLYDIVPRDHLPRTKKPMVGTWQQGRIVVRPDGSVEHWLNGERVVAYERGSADFRARVARSAYAKFPSFGEAASGPILLQDHGDRVSFRNLKLRPLAAKNSSAP